MNVLDTDSLSILQRGGGGEVYERLATRLDAVGPGGVHVTIVSFEEQMRGWLAFIARARNMTEQLRAYDRLLAFVDDFRLRPVLPFDERAAIVPNDSACSCSGISAKASRIAAGAVMV